MLQFLGILRAVVLGCVRGLPSGRPHLHRPIGLGVQGLADAFMMMRYPFVREPARKLNRDIFESIYFAACEAPCELASSQGPFETYAGSPASKGQLQFDLWGAKPGSGLWDWAGLKEQIARHGMRNSLLVAPMPTACTAQTLGNNVSFEPYTQDLYVRRTLSGEFVQVSRHLLRDLVERGLWAEVLRMQLVAHNGSVQRLDLPPDLKSLYETVWEIKQRTFLYTASPLRAFENELGVQNPVGFWDPLGFTAYGDQLAFKRRRCVGLKHGRISMLATLGCITPGVAGRFPGFLSPSSGLKFTDIPNGLAAVSKIPALGWVQMVAYAEVLRAVRPYHSGRQLFGLLQHHSRRLWFQGPHIKRPRGADLKVEGGDHQWPPGNDGDLGDVLSGRPHWQRVGRLGPVYRLAPACV